MTAGMWVFTTFCVKQISLLISVNSYIPCKENYEGQASSEVYDDDDDDYQIMTSCCWNFFFLPSSKTNFGPDPWTVLVQDGSTGFWTFYYLFFCSPAVANSCLATSTDNDGFFIAYCLFLFSFFAFFDDNQPEHTCTITTVTDFSKYGRKVLNFY